MKETFLRVWVSSCGVLVWELNGEGGVKRRRLGIVQSAASCI